MKKQGWIAFILLCISGYCEGQQRALCQLKEFADGLNIEGGSIPRDYLNEKQIWANLCVVLDRPFEEGIEWQEITERNIFPLKEASLLDYNEAQVNYAYAMILHYYITHAQELAKKTNRETAKILVQVHRNSSGPAHIELLEKLLVHCFPELGSEKSVCKAKGHVSTFYFPHQNVELLFTFGTLPDVFVKQGKYREVDIVLSFSLVAGLHPQWKSGTLLIPFKHVPFSLREMVLDVDTFYEVPNHLQEAALEIVQQQEERVLELINTYFRSMNHDKMNQRARFLTEGDFKSAVLLQVDGMFNPSVLPSSFEQKDNKEINIASNK